MLTLCSTHAFSNYNWLLHEHEKRPIVVAVLELRKTVVSVKKK